MTFNDNKIKLPRKLQLEYGTRLKVMRLMNREPLLYHMMIRQGITWFTLETELPEIV